MLEQIDRRYPKKIAWKDPAAKKRIGTTLPAENPITEAAMVNGIVQNPWRVNSTERRSGLNQSRTKKAAKDEAQQKTERSPIQRKGEGIDERI